jgi:hypothetical protein
MERALTRELAAQRTESERGLAQLRDESVAAPRWNAELSRLEGAISQLREEAKTRDTKVILITSRWLISDCNWTLTERQ